MAIPLFITGFPRSGTNLLRSILTQHDDIELKNETAIIRSLCSLGYSVNSRIKVTPELIEELKKNAICRNYLENHPEEYIRDLVKKNELLSFKEVYGYLLCKPRGSRVWGEKSLNNIFYLNEIQTMYPQAIIIRMIRDVRSCVLSKYTKDKKKMFHNTQHLWHHFADWYYQCIYFAQYAQLWDIWYQKSEQVIAQCDSPENIISVSYESFVQEPEKIIREICTRVNVLYDPSMLDVEKRKSDEVLKSKNAAAHQNIGKEIDASKIYSYRSLSFALCFVVERGAHDGMKKYGYERITKNVFSYIKPVLIFLLWVQKKIIENTVSKKMNTLCVRQLK